MRDPQATYRHVDPVDYVEAAIVSIDEASAELSDVAAGLDYLQREQQERMLITLAAENGRGSLASGCAQGRTRAQLSHVCALDPCMVSSENDGAESS